MPRPIKEIEVELRKARRELDEAQRKRSEFGRTPRSYLRHRQGQELHGIEKATLDSEVSTANDKVRALQAELKDAQK